MKGSTAFILVGGLVAAVIVYELLKPKPIDSVQQLNAATSFVKGLGGLGSAIGGWFSSSSDDGSTASSLDIKSGDSLGPLSF